MSRKITNEAVNAFMNEQNFKLGNTKVYKCYRGFEMSLHGHTIAIKEGNSLKITNAGWKSNTTKERLNGLPNVSICQKKGNWYLNGEEWDGKLIEIKQ